MKITLSRDGGRLAALDRQTSNVRIVELARRAAPITAEIAGAIDLAMFEDELWVAEVTTITRRTHELAVTASAAVLPGHRLVRCPYGAPHALWLPHAPQPAQLITARDGGLAVTNLDVDVGPGDLLLPVTAQRVLRARDGELALFDHAGAIRWRHGVARGRPLAIGALFEGRSVAALIARGGAAAQQLVVVDLREGTLQHRLALEGVSDAQFTALRNLGVLRVGTHELLVIDLRFGKVLRHHREPHAIDELAVDDSGQHVVLRIGEDVVDLPVADLIAGRLASVASARDSEVPAVAPSPAPSDAAPVPVVSSPAPVPALQIPTLRALRPLPTTPRASTAEAVALLDEYRALVAALAGRAAARGWDSGALSFVDETRPPFERELAAIVLDVRGLAPEQRRGAEHGVAVTYQRVAGAEQALAHAATPLDHLAAELGLSPLARRLLILVAAPSLWGELARVYGILANDPQRALCDELLLAQLLGDDVDRRAIGRELDRDQPLIRHGLIRAATDRPRPFASLQCEPLVLKILRADPLDADFDGTEPVAASRPIAELQLPRAELERVLGVLATDAAGPLRLVLRGRQGSGRRSLAAALAAEAGRRLGVVDAARFLREQRLESLALQLRRTALRGWIPLVDGLEVIGSDDRATRDAVRDILREHPGPLVVRLPHDAAPPLLPGYTLLDLPPLSEADRANHWRAEIARAELAVDDPDLLAARFGVGPGIVGRVVAAVAAQPTADVSRAIDRGIRQHLASRLGEVATPVTRLANWSQVVLPEDIHDSVLELIARIRHRQRVFDDWGFDRVMSTSRGITALFQGSPGTGKTLVAGAIANELGLDIYRVDLSRVMSKWIGETEQNLARVFAAAEEGQAILLFDEADSLFAKRTEVRSSNDRYANLEVNYLLQRFDTFEGIAILTTNFGTSIDPAFKRRLSFRLTFPFPDEDTRELLWKAHLPEKLPRAGTLDLATLARRYQMSGGYIRNAALRAAFLAAEEQSALTQVHLERAVTAEFRELGKLAETGVLE